MGPLYLAGIGTNAAGFGVGAAQYSNVLGGSWKGQNGNWYSLNWQGNQYAGSRSIALRNAGRLKVAGRGLFVAAAALSGIEGYGHLRQGNYSGAGKSGLDIGVAAFATFGHPVGMVLGAGYFLGATFPSKPVDTGIDWINIP